MGAEVIRRNADSAAKDKRKDLLSILRKFDVEDHILLRYLTSP